MASRVRILTVNRGEEVLIRVNSHLPITLEFPANLVTVYEQNGLVFQRIESQDSGSETHEQREEEAGSDDETQYLETQIEDYEDEETQVETQTQIEFTPESVYAPDTPPILLRDTELYPRRSSLIDDIEMLQCDLFGDNFFN